MAHHRIEQDAETLPQCPFRLSERLGLREKAAEAVAPPELRRKYAALKGSRWRGCTVFSGTSGMTFRRFPPGKPRKSHTRPIQRP